MKIGDKVIDDLTKEETTIVELSTDKFGNTGVKVDSNYLEGWRHPWEVTEQERNCEKCHGFIGIPGKIYGFAGKWCNCYMTEQFRDADDKKWAEFDEEMIERMRKMVEDYDNKKLLDAVKPPIDNNERIKNCKYVHIGGDGHCFKCGGIHEVLDLKTKE